MTDKMTVAIAAGGTAGHINPALALAEELRDRGHHVVFVGQSRKLEGRLVPEAGFDFVPITVTGFDRSRPWTALTSLWRVNKAKRALASHFSKVGKPDAAVGFGAYVEVPLLGWCKGAGVPYLLHEQNSVPGLANKMMNSHAARVCISVPAARSVFEREGDPDHVLMTGNPVRRSVIEGDRARGRKFPRTLRCCSSLAVHLAPSTSTSAWFRSKTSCFRARTSMCCIRRVPTALRRPSALWR